VGSSSRFADFETLKVGGQVTLRKKFTAADIDEFARLSGDLNPLHVDEEFAKRTRLRRRIAHGMLSAAYISSLVGTHVPGPGALWLHQSFEFLKPIFVSDEVEFLLRVEHKSQATRTLLICVEARNQQGVLVMKGQGKVMVLEEQKD
jgi:3-oxoacyl-[acyl-carrier protein] reductase